MHAPLTDTVLMTFDGTVVEFFGYTDVHRYHVWQQPTFEFTQGRMPRLIVRLASGGKHSLLYDRDRLEGLQAVAAEVARVVAEA
ncbi:hypothetical protein ACIA49_08055 [Kribbella sp. NPDC051587]|uniref:hypothetical protein n=1 Tax=Kribbella sp. NPDC051587 TaxID=3364119 RepID=UPI0037B8E786